MENSLCNTEKVWKKLRVFLCRSYSRESDDPTLVPSKKDKDYKKISNPFSKYFCKGTLSLSISEAGCILKKVNLFELTIKGEENFTDALLCFHSTKGGYS